MEIGDFLWIARRQSGAAPHGPAEVVLDFIVERKQVSDLASSIVSGRYHNQKERLHCAQMRHVMYLVEGEARDQQVLPPKSLEAAVCSTMLTDEFQMVLTPNVEGSCQVLQAMTREITRLYRTNRSGPSG